MYALFLWGGGTTSPSSHCDVLDHLHVLHCSMPFLEFLVVHFVLFPWPVRLSYSGLRGRWVYSLPPEGSYCFSSPEDVAFRELRE
jgi:hypothetical protein